VADTVIKARHHTHRGDWFELGDAILPSPRLSMVRKALHSRAFGKGRCSKGVDPVLDCTTKLIPIDKEKVFQRC